MSHSAEEMLSALNALWFPNLEPRKRFVERQLREIFSVSMDIVLIEALVKEYAAFPDADWRCFNDGGMTSPQRWIGRLYGKDILEPPAFYALLDPSKDPKEGLDLLKVLVDSGMPTSEAAMHIDYNQDLGNRIRFFNAIHVAGDAQIWDAIPLLLQGGCPVKVNPLTGQHPVESAFLADRLDIAMLVKKHCPSIEREAERVETAKTDLDLEGMDFVP